MNEVLQFLIRHGYAILFGVVFLEQAGLPIAAVPVLLGVGALSAEGRFSLAAALPLALLASLTADFAWYELGRRRGYGVLRVLCRISIEAESCVNRATHAFRSRGQSTLVVAKFIPGLGAIATPMAGLMGMSRRRFLLLDGAGATLWASLYLVLGVVFRTELEKIAAIIARAGTSMVAALVCMVGGYLAWKWLDRRHYIRQLAMARIPPEELWNRMQTGERFTILDLRHQPENGPEEPTLPGAIRFRPDQLEEKHHDIPRDRDIVLFCT